MDLLDNGEPPGWFESDVSALIRPVDGQRPRPWMTRLTDPSSASVFIVGANQATPYPTAQVRHDDLLDALFNRNGQTSDGLYEHMRRKAGKTGSSRTRTRIRGFTDRLANAGIHGILETNVICFGAGTIAEALAHPGGVERGRLIFRYLLATIRPDAIVSHGRDAESELQPLFAGALPEMASTPEAVAAKRVKATFDRSYTPAVIGIKHLAYASNDLLDAATRRLKRYAPS